MSRFFGTIFPTVPSVPLFPSSSSSPFSSFKFLSFFLLFLILLSIFIVLRSNNYITTYPHMSFVSPPLPPPPSETRFYCFAVTSPKPRSSGETGYESPRQNKDSWGCCSGFALRAHWKCTIFCFRLTHWLDQSQCNISICQLLQNDQECYWTLVKTKKPTRTYNKKLCSAGILKIIKLLCFFF